MKYLFSVLCLWVLGLTSITCCAFEGHSTSKDGSLNVIYKVDDGYKISIRIDTKKKNAAYQSSEKSDVSSIDVFFVDANKDGYLDVLIQHADETGYVPVLLINHDNNFFTNALKEAEKQFKTALYVNTEVDLIEDGMQQYPGGYQLKDMGNSGIPELFFYNAFIDGKGYRFVAFRFDKKTMNYHLYKKGQLFLDQNE